MSTSALPFKMSMSALPFSLLPAGVKLMHIHVSCREDGGQHVTEAGCRKCLTGFPCYVVEMTDTAQDAGSQTLLYLETTFSPIVFELVGHLCDLLRSVDMEFIVFNETPLEL